MDLLVHYLDTFKDIWEHFNAKYGEHFKVYLDTFKDIWELLGTVAKWAGLTAFRYLQGYMGTRRTASSSGGI